jgi:hypothetical protein
MSSDCKMKDNNKNKQILTFEISLKQIKRHLRIDRNFCSAHGEEIT